LIAEETPIYFAVVVHMSRWFVSSPERKGVVPSGLSLSPIGSVASLEEAGVEEVIIDLGVFA
jgi:hypothetical protein